MEAVVAVAAVGAVGLEAGVGVGVGGERAQILRVVLWTISWVSSKVVDMSVL
jgi:hypothetical protein